MKLKRYQVDAFTNKLFGGNPACVVPLDDWLPDEIMLKIARENSVAETAFFVKSDDEFYLRWFTPEIEMDLCGHATLATAHILFSALDFNQKELLFKSISGDLKVYNEDSVYILDFPSRKPIRTAPPEIVLDAFSKQPLKVLKARDYILVYGREEDIRSMKVDRQMLDQINLDPGGIIITAPGGKSDFVSRFFTPQASIFEDPVTGSAHCSLIPFWSKQLGKKKMLAHQLSDRFGTLFCEDKGERVLIGGNARTYSEGQFFVN